MSRIYRYHRATQSGSEVVEFDIRKGNGDYVTTCVVNVRLLIDGIKTHPCGDGDDITLSKSAAIEVLKIVKRERDNIRLSGQIKTLAGWRDCGFNLGDYLVSLDEVDEALVDEQAEVVPPHIMKNGYLQVGEPYCNAPDDNGDWHPTWTTFIQNGRKWTYLGHCFSDDTINRIKDRDRVQEAINALTA